MSRPIIHHRLSSVAGSKSVGTEARRLLSMPNLLHEVQQLVYLIQHLGHALDLAAEPRQDLPPCRNERVQHDNAEMLEVPHVARHHGELVYLRGGGNHGVLIERV